MSRWTCQRRDPTWTHTRSGRVEAEVETGSCRGELATLWRLSDCRWGDALFAEPTPIRRVPWAPLLDHMAELRRTITTAYDAARVAWVALLERLPVRTRAGDSADEWAAPGDVEE